MTNAAIYLRSSKDRHDLSLSAQRQALHQAARERGFVVAAEFADAVESGKDEDRDGFQQLLGSLRDKARGWSVLLVLDTSRLARRRHLALIFEHEAERAGVQVIYRNVPDTDPITAMLLRSILQAMDEWHSLVSRAKGLAGMAESVRQGYRAGGPAPRGYRLEHAPTGAIRDGTPVMRSKLTPTETAPAVAAYLQARAQGKPRGIASQLSGLTGSLNDLEWRALTYAGHTVWNQASERSGAGYKGGSKYRPREEWKITRDTHPALITDVEAEAILAQLAAGQGRRTRASDRAYLLSGLLISPDGTGWNGEHDASGAFYRLGRGAKISAPAVESAILDRIFADLTGPDAAARIADRMRAAAMPRSRPRDLLAMRAKAGTLARKIDKLVDLLAEDVDAAAAYRRAIGKMEAERAALLDELAEAERETETAELVALWTPADVQRMLTDLLGEIKGGMDDGEVLRVRALLSGLVEKIEMDPATRQAIIHYRLDTGLKLALPRDRSAAPVVWTSGSVVIARLRR